MKNIVAKILRSDLRLSGLKFAIRMAGPYYSQNERPWKYLTKHQVERLQEFGLNPVFISEDEAKEIETLFNQRVIKAEYKKVIVTYLDEDGENEVQFNSDAEANNWIQAQESRLCSGEKFEFISKDYI